METDKKLTIKDSIQSLVVTTDKIDTIIAECLPIMNNLGNASIQESLVLAKGMELLQTEFKNSLAIKATILNMANKKIGFMTDRSPSAIKYAKAKQKKEIIPYTYDELAECCIEALLKGYRLISNEFNVIAGGFYAAKNGKYRKITEYPGINNFKFGTGLPEYTIQNQLAYNGVEKVQYAQISCWAEWELNAKKNTIGKTNKTPNEEPMIFNIRVNAGMGNDALVGKALSKLFSMVLFRLDGILLSESTDISIDTELNAPEAVEPVSMTNQIKNRTLPADKTTIPTSKDEPSTDRDSLIKNLKNLIKTSEIPPVEFAVYSGVENIDDMETKDIELYVNNWDKFIAQFNKDLDIGISRG